MPPKKAKNLRKAKEAERERSRVRRQLETEEAKSTRLDDQKKYDDEKKKSLSQKELDESLQLKRDREAKARTGMPQPIRLNWLKNKQLHEKSKVDSMSPERKEEWYEQKRAQEKSRVHNMSPEKRGEWHEQKKAREKSRRDDMSTNKKVEWHKQKQSHEKSRRDDMSPSKKEEWHKQKQAHEKSRRDDMSPSKKEKWHKQKQVHEKSRRDDMSPTKKEEWHKQKKVHEKSRRDDMSPDKKEQTLHQHRTRQATKRKSEKMEGISIEQAGENFRKTLTDLPEYVCTCCHRLLWRRSVIKFDRSKYDITSEVIQKCFAEDIMYETKPNEIYICTTCNSSLKGKHPAMPAQAVANGLRLEPIPTGLEIPNDMERMTFRKKIPFMKMGALPRGKQWRLQGPCVNVPSNLEAVCNLLPRLPNDALLVPIKLKRRLCYKGHYMYEAIRPQVVLEWIRWLKEYNPHYLDVQIQLDFCNLMACLEKEGKSK